MKLQRKPVPLIYPNPVVLVTSVDEKGKPDVITVTLAGSCCIQPPIISIGVGRNQYSKGLIEAAEEFVVNIPTEDQLAQVEYCGLVSRRSVDKFLETGFRLTASSNVRPPLIDECPVNLECRVVEKLPLGTNVLFLGEVLCLHVDEDVLDEKGGSGSFQGQTDHVQSNKRVLGSRVKAPRLWIHQTRTQVIEEPSPCRGC